MWLQSRIDCTAKFDNNTNTLAGDWRHKAACRAGANQSAESPEIGTPGEVTYAGSFATLRCIGQRGQVNSLNATVQIFCQAEHTLVESRTLFAMLCLRH